MRAITLLWDVLTMNIEHGRSTIASWLEELFPVGTRSVLWGAHCFFIHPWFVAAAWTKLYGFPRDLPLWVAFFIHDLGYFGKPNMDGEEGERHVEWGAKKVEEWFPGHGYGSLCMLHSRYYARKLNLPISRLCVADKLSVTLEPVWLYMPRVWLSGELTEYLNYATGRVESNHSDKGNDYAEKSKTPLGWHRAMTTYLRTWVKNQPNGPAWFFVEVKEGSLGWQE